ncbi:diacylglycerol/lipid kinase family protein [Lentibacillus sp. JNUCC-1]|uniref:diacylglycerol/lipid kinase family protein n=1 Tax=Lentibacillus sp. JNUCC-1 TaxID=2654513 RepID=UPI003FA5D273
MFEHIIQYGVTIPYWCGTYAAEETGSRQFVNSIGFGFDAEIAKYANTSKHKNWLRFFRLDSFRYVFALIHILFHFKPFNATLTLDGRRQDIQSCWMVTVANHPYYGGGMKIIPHAKIEPEIFPVLVIHGISKWKILALFVTVFTGKHLSFKEVDCHMASKVEFHSESKVQYQVDGQTDSCMYGVVEKNSDATHIVGDFDGHMLEKSSYFR